MIPIINNEQELHDFPFVVAGRHPVTHFHGYCRRFFEHLNMPEIAIYLNDMSSCFLERYKGTIICIAAHYANEISLRKLDNRVVLMDHAPLPTSWRHPNKLYAKYLLTNGSRELLKRTNYPDVSNIVNCGFFPTDDFLYERQSKKAMVQLTTRNIAGTWKDQCSFRMEEVCQFLLENDFDVHVFNHVMHPTDLNGLPKEVRRVEPGLDYIQTLSSSSHFLFTGTSGFITNMFTTGANMICLSHDWAKKNSELFQEFLYGSCYFPQSINDLPSVVLQKPKYKQEMSDLLFGQSRERKPVTENIRQIFTTFL